MGANQPIFIVVKKNFEKFRIIYVFRVYSKIFQKTVKAQNKVYAGKSERRNLTSVHIQ